MHYILQPIGLLSLWLQQKHFIGAQTSNVKQELKSAKYKRSKYNLFLYFQ